MKILVTGAAGFVGKNLCASLKNIRDGKDKTRNLTGDITIFEYDIDTDPTLLDTYTKECMMKRNSCMLAAWLVVESLICCIEKQRL